MIFVAGCEGEMTGKAGEVVDRALVSRPAGLDVVLEVAPYTITVEYDGLNRVIIIKPLQTANHSPFPKACSINAEASFFNKPDTFTPRLLRYSICF